MSCPRTTCISPSRPGPRCPVPARARAVAAAVCGLPAMPRVVMNCPADLGVSYRLSFAAGSRGFPVVTVSAGGCTGVAGAGPVRSASPLTRVLDRPGPRHGHQQRRGPAGHQPGQAGHRGGQARHQPGRVRPHTARPPARPPRARPPGARPPAGRQAAAPALVGSQSLTLSRKGEHDLGAIRLRRRHQPAPARGGPGRAGPRLRRPDGGFRGGLLAVPAGLRPGRPGCHRLLAAGGGGPGPLLHRR